MKKRHSHKVPPQNNVNEQIIVPAQSLPVINPNAAGIDIGTTEHYVCVPTDAVPKGQPPVRRFGAFTAELDSLVEWLQHCRVTTVAMESTSIYWIALSQKLETAGLDVILVNARHMKQVPGRKTDVKDCQWIQRLHSYGLLNGSFRPDDAICRLRTLMRHRSNLIADSGEQLQHMQAALQQMNIHRHLGGRTNTCMGAFHRRMRSRLGPAEANTATARKLACLIYHLIKYQEPYIELDRLLYEEKIQRHRLAKLRKQAKDLGYEVVEIKEAA